MILQYFMEVLIVGVNQGENQVNDLENYYDLQNWWHFQLPYELEIAMNKTMPFTINSSLKYLVKMLELYE